MTGFRNGVRLEKGMQVDVITDSDAQHPFHFMGGQLIVDAFRRIYGIDMKKANAITSSVIDVKRVQ
ncbi:hypothetical protein A3SI_20062 [Nitritalea halalkaliphila LW7]|uniref:Uncharacterized protein n=2 Tax=Nitritalea TaxID=1187887 RepID=I5BR30_9BACT|nr:hypothetical protein A3SI_20062 [Nitritalea halalkaliphila LW7]